MGRNTDSAAARTAGPHSRFIRSTAIITPGDSGAENSGFPANRRSGLGIAGAVPAVAFAVILLLLTTTSQGGFAVSRWAPLTLFVLAVLLGAVVVGKRAPVIPVWARVSLAGIWGLAGFSMVSMLWAQSSGDAFAAADRVVLYAALCTLPFVLPLRRGDLAAAGWAITAGVAAVALFTLLQLLAGDDSLFLAGRLNGPINYRNGTALLFALPVWPLIMAAAKRAWQRSLRALAFAAAVLCLGLVFLTQSRGILLGLLAGALVALLIGPDRVRRAWLAILAAAMIAASAHWLLRPFHAFEGGAGVVSSSEIAVAARALGVLSLLALALGFAVALFDRGLRSDSPSMRRFHDASRWGLAVMAVVAICGAAAAIGNPVSFARHEWDQFTNLNASTSTATRYASVGGQRYDLWRVAVKEWESAPFLGVGADNYWFDYYRYRHTNRNLTDPHSLLFALLSETGLVGVLLFGAFLAGMAVALARGWRRLEPDRRIHAVAPAAAGVVLLGQSLVDWIWLIPGLTAVGLLALALASAQVARADEVESSVEPVPPDLAESSSIPPLDTRWRPGRPGPLLSPLTDPLRLVSGAVLLLAMVAVLGLYLSNAYVERARALDGAPGAELAAARTAASLDPWSVTPHYLEASALESMGRRPASDAQLRDALALEPGNFATLAVLGDFEVRSHHLAAARTYYRRALALAPLDTGLQQLAKYGLIRRTGGRVSRSTTSR